MLYIVSDMKKNRLVWGRGGGVSHLKLDKDNDKVKDKETRAGNSDSSCIHNFWQKVPVAVAGVRQVEAKRQELKMMITLGGDPTPHLHADPRLFLDGCKDV